MKEKLLWLLVFSSLAGCEKALDLQLDKQETKVVVEAQIENGQPPLVTLSRSLDYFNTIDTTILSNSFIHNAVITISEGNNQHVLKEYSQRLSTGNSLFFYSNAPGDNFVGATDTKYNLLVAIGGQTFSASTTIPRLTKKIDSLWWKKAPNNTDSSKVVLMAKITDPPGLGNYIRYFTRVNREGFYPGYNSVFDDQIVDGKSYEVSIDKGVSKNEPVKREDRGYLNRGDTVVVKFCNIDKASYDFWRTWEFNFQSIGNPFSSPGKVIGNISNGGLGAFYGYAAQYKSLVIPK